MTARRQALAHAAGMRPSTSTSRSRYARTRGASIASCTVMPNSTTFSSICGVVWRMPYEPGVPIDRRNAPSRKTWVGAMRVCIGAPPRSTAGLPGSTSAHMRRLLRSMPVPGTMTPEPNGLPSVCVTVTTVPSPSATAKCVVCSFAKSAGWPGQDLAGEPRPRSTARRPRRPPAGDR